MRWAIPLTCAALTSVFLAGSIEPSAANSPGAADDPLPASDDDLHTYVGVAQEMHGRWQSLDAACDPDAVFGLLYLITTAKVGDLVAADHFEDNPYLVEWDADFAGRYFVAYDAYHDPFSAASVPEPWRKAFEHADSGTSTVTEDLLLGMSAHVNYDLAHSAAAMGLPGMENGKTEYDRVNDAFWNVVVPVGDELGARYDPSQARDGEGELGPTDYGTVELLISWRENAWANAVLLHQAAGDPLATAAVEAKIIAEANAVAAGLVEGNPGEDTTSWRPTYCAASGHPPLAASLGGPGYGDDWFADAPGEFLVCHAPGKPGQRTMTVNEHAWAAHEHHGDAPGACPE